ncbi:MAG: septum formation initiator family protein [Clostridia bacterium]
MDKKKKKVNIRVLLKRCVLCGLILYICYLFLAQQFDLSRLSKENDSLDQQIAEAQREHEELSDQKEASGTPEYIERVARDKLGYMKPDEKVFIDAKKQ